MEGIPEGDRIAHEQGKLGKAVDLGTSWGQVM